MNTREVYAKRLLLNKPSVTQQVAGIENREVVLEHDLYDIIINIHMSLLRAGRSTTFQAINERYYGSAKAEVKFHNQ